jgi:hypothetical protein
LNHMFAVQTSFIGAQWAVMAHKDV